MLSELVFDTVVRGHQDAQKAKRPCRCCGTYCSLPHPPGSKSSTNLATSASGQPPKGMTGSSGSGTPTKDTNILLTCPSCARPVASNRCAQHLANCMGIGTGRRGARNAKAKQDQRAASPYIDSPDEPSSSQKSKKKKDSNSNGKRPPSPSLLDTPTKKPKKMKANSVNDLMEIGSTSSSQGASRARKGSTASSIANNLASPSPSMYSSPESADSTDTGGSSHTQPKQAGLPKPVKVKSISGATVTVASAAAIPRGPPGSSKGRIIAAARLHGDADANKDP